MTAAIGAATAMDRLLFGFHGFCLGTNPNASMMELVDRAGAYHKSEKLFSVAPKAVNRSTGQLVNWSTGEPVDKLPIDQLTELL